LRRTNFPGLFIDTLHPVGAATVGEQPVRRHDEWRRAEARRPARTHGPAPAACATRCRPGAAAFTLVELLVVVAVVALLASLLLPALTASRAEARRVACLSNQRQIGLAILTYAQDYDDVFPIAHYFDAERPAYVAWDTITPLGDPNHAEPGLIWRHVGHVAVQQCPSYFGPSMTTGDPYTGYNYNTTYIGRGQYERPYRDMSDAPARAAQIRRPAETALVGDGGYAAGANKFMRATLDPAEDLASAGTQAYRHRDVTNVLFVDGHAESTGQRFLRPGLSASLQANVDWPHNGFLSEDDRIYDRE